jgi:hypothetical protein
MFDLHSDGNVQLSSRVFSSFIKHSPYLFNYSSFSISVMWLVIFLSIIIYVAKEHSHGHEFPSYPNQLYI